jgi:hypothetical protein
MMIALLPVMGAGTNIVSKGDAFGLGVTEQGVARAFVNAGQDLLFRGEAPRGIGGAVVDSDIVGAGWHNLTMTYDGDRLTIYIDGVPRKSARYNRPPADNPFPILIGDGWEGAIRDVTIYGAVLTPTEIDQHYRAERTED